MEEIFRDDVCVASYTKKDRRTKAQMQELRSVLYGMLEAEHPMTVRQVFYRMVGRGLVQKTEAEYNGTVGRLLREMREREQLPYEWLADSTRWVRQANSYSTMEEFLQITAEAYRKTLWINKPGRVEIWCEKEALAGILMQETVPWDVPLYVSKGYSSLTYLYEAAQAIKHSGKATYIYSFGDRDPRGVHIPQVVERKLRRLAPDSEIHFERVAVTEEQIEKWNLPLRPNKKKDTMRKKFKGLSVELDSIPPDELRALVRGCISRHMDDEERMKILETEKLERESLFNYFNGYI